MVTGHTHSVIDKYLAGYSEPESTLVSTWPDDWQAHHCVVIPAYNETPEFVLRLKHSLLAQQQTLFIVIINQPDAVTKEDPANQHLWDILRANLRNENTPLWHKQHLYCCHWEGTTSRLLLVERFKSGNRIPQQQGVGLVRKIGIDIATRLYRLGVLLSHWVHTSDADTHLPDDYFSATTQTSSQTSGIVYPYQHISACSQSTAITQATLLYEQALHYYVERLQSAGSPYSFHTLGSCIAVNIDHYAQVRGFPKRAAGEDFYLLNKLAKQGEILQPTTPILTIEARRSARVPFGTGPAIEKILAMENPEREYRYYHPLIFDQLGELLHQSTHLYTYKRDWTLWLSTLSAPTQDALRTLKVSVLLAHLTRQGRSAHHCQYHFNQWFDGFKTLKFIRHLRQHYPDIPLKNCLAAVNTNTNR